MVQPGLVPLTINSRRIPSPITTDPMRASPLPSAPALSTPCQSGNPPCQTNPAHHFTTWLTASTKRTRRPCKRLDQTNPATRRPPRLLWETLVNRRQRC